MILTDAAILARRIPRTGLLKSCRVFASKTTVNVTTASKDILATIRVRKINGVLIYNVKDGPTCDASRGGFSVVLKFIFNAADEHGLADEAHNIAYALSEAMPLTGTYWIDSTTFGTTRGGVTVTVEPRFDGLFSVRVEGGGLPGVAVVHDADDISKIEKLGRCLDERSHSYVYVDEFVMSSVDDTHIGCMQFLCGRRYQTGGILIKKKGAVGNKALSYYNGKCVCTDYFEWKDGKLYLCSSYGNTQVGFLVDGGVGHVLEDNI